MAAQIMQTGYDDFLRKRVLDFKNVSWLRAIKLFPLSTHMMLVSSNQGLYVLDTEQDTNSLILPYRVYDLQQILQGLY